MLLPAPAPVPTALRARSTPSPFGFSDLRVSASSSASLSLRLSLRGMGFYYCLPIFLAYCLMSRGGDLKEGRGSSVRMWEWLRILEWEEVGGTS